MLVKYRLWIRCPNCGKKFITEDPTAQCPFCLQKLKVDLEVKIYQLANATTDVSK
ncbi:protein of unknown function (DUF329) [Pyrobaculum oguniense TE7]|uniref:Uncharacterized protein n=1 Tax=Pyrobaculum oguniense (strain DSM 13380 / JCM 10595 / TE7) TaxID=698757 RepID=H6Q889_PYROT|nr:protein of unknown function (DUF329) [Pyrobaculum oguniense TE7]